jgi:photosystem II stability/assembly factor-like uncharacterized protein
MKRSKSRTGLAAAIQALCAAALCGGVNQWTSHGPPVPIISLTADPADPRTVYAARHPSNGSGVFRSLDGGETWEALTVGEVGLQEGIRCLAADPILPTTLYAGTLGGKVLRSADGGDSWETRTLDTDLTDPIPVGALAVDAVTDAVYAGSDRPFRWSPVYKSTDGGGSWRATGLAEPRAIYALLADSVNRTIFAGTDWAYDDYGFSYIYPFGGAVARTTDGGTTWALSATDLGSSVTALASDADGSSVYAGTAYGAVYRSFDGGVNWNLTANLPYVSALVVDPVAPAVLYAATNLGVLRSRDRGASWRPFNAGMAPVGVTSLTIDSTGKYLHAGTYQGVFDIEIAAPQPLAPCAPVADHLCLFGSRFRIGLAATDPRSGIGFTALGVPGDDRSGYFSFPTLTGDPTFPEVFVKMVDATSLPGGGFLVFHGSMTSAPYTLTVTDTTTGLVREYRGENFCGGADVIGFLPPSPWDYLEAASPLGASEALLHASAPELALLSGRFRITLTARNLATDTEAAGVAIPQADRFGSFSLPAFTGDPNLPEVFVKMIDATGGAFLFFHSGLTSLPYTLTVVDTVTGTGRTYANDPVTSERLCGEADLVILPE